MQQAQPQEGTPVIPGNYSAISSVARCRRHCASLFPTIVKTRRAFDAGSAAFNQLHNSLNGGSAGHDGIDDALPPGPVLNPLVDPPVDPVNPVDPEPLLAP
jgi:hypothetical protein